ncbi:MAG: hypothetical protein AAF530_12270 [Pseudomonadota bacterium]
MRRFFSTSAIVFTGAAIALTITSTAAQADLIEDLEAKCHEQLQLGDAGCACVRERVADMLNEDQQRLLFSMVSNDSATMNSLMSQMPQDQVGATMNFMSETPDLCAQ